MKERHDLGVLFLPFGLFALWYHVTSLHRSQGLDLTEMTRAWRKDKHTHRETDSQKCWGSLAWALKWGNCSTLEARHAYLLELNKEARTRLTAKRGLKLTWVARVSIRRAAFRLWNIRGRGQSYGGQFLHTLATSAWGRGFAIFPKTLIWPRPCQQPIFIPDFATQVSTTPHSTDTGKLSLLLYISLPRPRVSRSSTSKSHWITYTYKRSMKVDGESFGKKNGDQWEREDREGSGVNTIKMHYTPEWKDDENHYDF